MVEHDDEGGIRGLLPDNRVYLLALVTDVLAAVQARDSGTRGRQTSDEHVEAAPGKGRDLTNEVDVVLPQKVSLDPRPVVDQTELGSFFGEVGLSAFGASPV